MLDGSLFATKDVHSPEEEAGDRFLSSVPFAIHANSGRGEERDATFCKEAI